MIRMSLGVSLVLGIVACRATPEQGAAERDGSANAAALIKVATPLLTALPAPAATPQDPFRLRKQLRSASANERLAGSISVVSSPATYSPSTVRLALSNLAKTSEIKACPYVAQIIASSSDVTTRAHAAAALGLLDRNYGKTSKGKLSPKECSEILATCLSGSTYPNTVKRACAEAIGVAGLSAYNAALQSVLSSSTSDAGLTLMAARALTRIQQVPVIKPEMVTKSRLLPLPE